MADYIDFPHLLFDPFGIVAASRLFTTNKGNSIPNRAIKIVNLTL